MDLSPNLIVASNYRLEAILGSGAAGTVWKATDLSLGREVALKVLRTELLRDEAQNERFRREARLLASLNHPGLVTIHALVSVEDEHGRVAPAIVMPFVAGRLLSDVLRDEGPFDLLRATVYLRELIEALAAAHAVGVVHRDLKPQNIMLERRDAPGVVSALQNAEREHVRVLDFGIARSTGGPITSSSVVAAQAGVMIGTPGYMSPEQIADPARVDGRADLWSASVCFYEMLTRALPFAGANSAEQVGNVLAGAWRPSRQVNPALPVEADVFFTRVFHRQLAARPRDVAEMLAALAPLVSVAERMPAASSISAVPPVPSSSLSSSAAATASAGPVGSATLVAGSMAAYVGSSSGLLAAVSTASNPNLSPVSNKTLVSASSGGALPQGSGQFAAPQISGQISGQFPAPAGSGQFSPHTGPGKPAASTPVPSSAPSAATPAPSLRPEAAKSSVPQVLVRIGDAPPAPLPPSTSSGGAQRPSGDASLVKTALIALVVAVVLGGVGIGAFLLAQR